MFNARGPVSDNKTITLKSLTTHPCQGQHTAIDTDVTYLATDTQFFLFVLTYYCKA